MENTKTTFRPILFSTPMVQAILENRKTMTRRTKGLEKFNLSPDRFRYDGIEEGYKALGHAMEQLDENGKETEKYFQVIPAYNIGDVLWVRETFREIEQDFGKPRYEYKATETINLNDKWKPSIFMPKQACRIFLRLKSIRVERLQDVSEEDVKEEGIIIPKNGENILWELGKENSAFSFMDKSWRNRHREYHSSKEVFFCHWAELWCKINGRDSWNQNPYVFVYEFEQIEKPLDFIL